MSKPHVTHNSGKSEWYTPPHIIEKARATMGEIDLDPASAEVANTIVRAGRYITKEEDGISIDTMWGTKNVPVSVWLNPPYSRNLINQFADRLLAEISNSRVYQAVWLSNNATETVWGQKLLRKAKVVCFPYRRVKFLDADLNPTGSPLQGQMLIGLGNVDIKQFTMNFNAVGVCSVRPGVLRTI